MKGILFPAAAAVLFTACNSGSGSGTFEVNGTLSNNTGKVIYLEQLPMATMQPLLVDSAELGADGKFSLETKAAEACVFNLRLDRSGYPFASVINDSREVTVNVSFSKGNKEFPEKYEVTGSEASIRMRDFMFAFNEQLQSLFFNDQKIDSLEKAGAPDSAFLQLDKAQSDIAAAARALFDSSIKRSNNPALSMFELGYYQSTANNSNYRLIPVADEEVKKIIDDLAKKYPSHRSLASIKGQLDAQQQADEKQEAMLAKRIGKPAPDFTLPDPSGKSVSLSSFKGKYVLIDFWASWCGPCRQENPNLVSAYNKYRDKNFTILGVSLDKPGQKEKWLKAVRDDKLAWTQVSDLMEWNSPLVNLYNFGDMGIPYNVLVDPQGTIIAERLRGEDLDKKLAEVLK